MPVSRLEVILLDHVSDDFSVGFSGEFVAFFDELTFQRDIVFDDAVVHDDDGSGAVAMGMRVLFGGAAVSGPAGMADAVGSVERLEADDFFEVAQLAFGAADLQAFTIAADCDPSRVVAAIFQTPQPVDNYGHHTLLTYISNDATHFRTPNGS